MVECDLAKVEVASSNLVSRFGNDKCGTVNEEMAFIHRSAFFIQHRLPAARTGRKADARKKPEHTGSDASVEFPRELVIHI